MLVTALPLANLIAIDGRHPRKPCTRWPFQKDDTLPPNSLGEKRAQQKDVFRKEAYITPTRTIYSTLKRLIPAVKLSIGSFDCRPNDILSNAIRHNGVHPFNH